METIADRESGRTDYKYVDMLSLNNREIEFFEIMTINTAYCFARSRANSTPAASWHILEGRPDMIGKTVQLFGINRSGKLQEVVSGGRLGIYYPNEQGTYTWYTSKILSLSISKRNKSGDSHESPSK